MSKTGGKKTGVSLAQANRMISQLSRQYVPPCCEREDLDAPLDADIQVTPAPGLNKISLMVDGQEVSWCRVYDFKQQVGTQLVRMGGIGDVGTHGEHRFKGYSRRVMDNSNRWMRQAGYDVAMLVGIPGFYPKFGYAESFPTVTWSMAVRDAELGAAGRLRFRDFTEEDLPAVLRLYRSTNAGRTGVIVRPPGSWVPFRQALTWGPKPAVQVAVGAGGKIVGYLVRELSADGTVIEIGYADDSIFGDLLKASAALAWTARVDTIRFLLPADDAFMGFCRRYGVRKEVECRRCGGLMARMINVPSALAKITPLLASRMSGRGRLTIRTNLDNVGLAWGGGRLTVGKPARGGLTVKLPQWALAQLLYGYHGADALATAGTLAGSKRAVDILARMFPPTPHYMYRVDYF